MEKEYQEYFMPVTHKTPRSRPTMNQREMSKPSPCSALLWCLSVVAIALAAATLTTAILIGGLLYIFQVWFSYISNFATGPKTFLFQTLVENYT